jgi:hypothetical protein
MKKEIYLIRISVLLLIIVIVFACRKSVNSTDQTTAQNQNPWPHRAVSRRDSSMFKQDSQAVLNVPYPQAPISGCSYAPDYGDSIVYPQPTTGGNDYFVSPVNNPGAGTYLSWPQGLVINSATGAIDLTQSETGERFDIGFVKAGTSDTCLTSLILAGASYMDSVYVLADGENQAFPYFNANPYLASVCGTNGTSGSCKFDVTGSAKNLKVIVDQNSGMIDLQKTLNGSGGLLSTGAFGLLPINGQAVSPDIYYQLNDGSNMALQHITVNIIYYDSKSQISSGLLGGITGLLNNILLDVLIMNQGNPRPPMIIITRFN